MVMSKSSIFWFRRDLRTSDNHGLYKALTSGQPVRPIFIFDKNILQRLEDIDDARVTFIYDTIAALKAEIQAAGSDLEVYYGKPEEIFKMLIESRSVQSVFCNHDYDPYSVARDKSVKSALNKEGIEFYSYKDHVIFEKEEVVKDDGKPYTVFTPYSRKWYEKLEAGGYQALEMYPSVLHLSSLFKTQISNVMPSLEDMGFVRSSLSIPPAVLDLNILPGYKENRDIPGIPGTSRLGIHLRFGTLSVRSVASAALPLSQTYINELIWRDFYSMILQWFPHVASRSFRAEYDHINWLNNEKEFIAWCEGRTGYPLVDAGMRELSATGYMHNRVRMVTASFLVKHLLIDWRWGEAWFARKLLDYDLASNNGGWQWAAGCGTDAAPYFRIFNPLTQMEKFDPNLAYVHRWVPEYGTSAYPQPVVDHKFARERCLSAFAAALKK